MTAAPSRRDRACEALLSVFDHPAVVYAAVAILGWLAVRCLGWAICGAAAGLAVAWTAWVYLQLRFGGGRSG